MKVIVFATPGLAKLAACRRARAVEKGYARILRQYERVPPRSETTEKLLLQSGGERLMAFRSLKRRPRVLFVGTDPDQDRGGVLQGLRSSADITVFTQPDGRYGQVTEEGILSLSMARANGSRLLAMLEETRTRRQPIDLVIGQMLGGYMDPFALAQARATFATLVVNMAMDDRHAYSGRKLGRRFGTKELIGVIDLAATAAPEAVDWYLKEGRAAIFLPEASDASLFRPRPDLPKLHDVCFVGARYGIREEIVTRLLNAGVDVRAHGVGWPGGRIDLHGVATLFAQSRIVLGVGAVGHSRRLVALKMRDFDGPMSGSCYVTQDNPDLSLVYRVGEEIAVYTDASSCVDLVLSLLRDDTRREAIASRGRQRAAREHTWRARFSSIIGFLDGEATAYRGSTHGWDSL